MSTPPPLLCCSFLLMRPRRSGRRFPNGSPAPLQQRPLSSPPGFPRAKREAETEEDVGRKAASAGDKIRSVGKGASGPATMTRLLLFGCRSLGRILLRSPQKAPRYRRRVLTLHFHEINVSKAPNVDRNPLQCERFVA